jgi:hypothetical protein
VHSVQFIGTRSEDVDHCIESALKRCFLHRTANTGSLEIYSGYCLGIRTAACDSSRSLLLEDAERSMLGLNELRNILRLGLTLQDVEDGGE